MPTARVALPAGARLASSASACEHRNRSGSDAKPEDECIRKRGAGELLRSATGCSIRVHTRRSALVSSIVTCALHVAQPQVVPEATANDWFRFTARPHEYWDHRATKQVHFCQPLPCLGRMFCACDF